jgi:transcriptional regulator with XRE-family HTH domain
VSEPRHVPSGPMQAAKEFAERLRRLMEAQGYEPRPAVLEREFNERFWGRGVTFQTASSWLRGAAIPTQDKLEVLAEWLKVEPQVLRYGDKAAKGIRDAHAVWPGALPAPDRAAIEAFLALPRPQRKLVRELVHALAVPAPASDKKK